MLPSERERRGRKTKPPKSCTLALIEREGNGDLLLTDLDLNRRRTNVQQLMR